jgi:hypothetical protein
MRIERQYNIKTAFPYFCLLPFAFCRLARKRIIRHILPCDGVAYV